MEDLHEEDYPDLNRYTEPRGLPSLVDAFLDRRRARTGEVLERRNVVVTGGATSGLFDTVAALVSPGDEVLLLAPYWPLVAGIVRILGATPVPVPFFDRVEGAADAIALLDAARTARTVALYVNSPNNPTGRVLPPPVVEAITGWARGRDLWILADEVYEDCLFRGEHLPPGLLAPERTVSHYSFSKAYGMAGFRCGISTGPAAVADQMLKVHTHTVYSTQTASQVAALRALGPDGDAWQENARASYRETAERAASRLGVAPPDGSTFLFVDVARHLDERGLEGFLERCAARGLFAAPGPSFGPFPTHLRVCFTSVPPDVALRGLDILANLVGRDGTEKTP